MERRVRKQDRSVPQHHHSNSPGPCLQCPVGPACTVLHMDLGLRRGLLVAFRNRHGSPTGCSRRSCGTCRVLWQCRTRTHCPCRTLATAAPGSPALLLLLHSSQGATLPWHLVQVVPAAAASGNKTFPSLPGSGCLTCLQVAEPLQLASPLPLAPSLAP